MLTKDFYKLLDKEFDEIVSKHLLSDYFKSKDQNGKKSAAFLVWFLNNYCPAIENVSEYITDGADDCSCDLIYDNIDSRGEKCFYVIQAKWFSLTNSGSADGVSGEIKKCLSDFELILSGQKPRSEINEKFNLKYEELRKHISENRPIKFVFLSLCPDNPNADANITRFVRNPLVAFEKLHIEKLKRHYIELRYKGVRSRNPIEVSYEPANDVMLTFIAENKYVEVSHPFPSRIFIISPEQIYKLYDRFGTSLFYKNIRNPLHNSYINLDIEKTLLENPAYFWYFNNGITAITREIKPIHEGNNMVTVTGFQVINGAQTVSSIYRAYKEALPEKRHQINLDAKVTLRVIKAGGTDFDLKVTRFTNSQNPIQNRDFYANDPIQVRLQNDFFENTNIWYEKRRGEFEHGNLPDNVKVVPNEVLAQAYLAYYLQQPILAKNATSKFFRSKTVDSTEGLYEVIFNDSTSCLDMRTAYYLFMFIEKKKSEYKRLIKTKMADDFEFTQHSSMHILAIYKEILRKKYHVKSINGRVMTAVTRVGFGEFGKIYNRIICKMKPYISKKFQKDSAFSLSKYFKQTTSYDELKKLMLNA